MSVEGGDGRYGPSTRPGLLGSLVLHYTVHTWSPESEGWSRRPVVDDAGWDQKPLAVWRSKWFPRRYQCLLCGTEGGVGVSQGRVLDAHTYESVIGSSESTDEVGS